MRAFWTAERVSLMQRLWHSGLTAEAISAELGGLSRSAVLGKIHRLRRAGDPTAAPKMRPRLRTKQDEPPRRRLAASPRACSISPTIVADGRSPVRGAAFCSAVRQRRIWPAACRTAPITRTALT